MNATIGPTASPRRDPVVGATLRLSPYVTRTFAMLRPERGDRPRSCIALTDDGAWRRESRESKEKSVRCDRGETLSVQYSPFRQSPPRWEVAAIVLNAVLSVGLLLVFLGPLQALLSIAIHQGCSGLSLGLVFTPKHKGMAVVDDAMLLDPLRAQVITARNVRGNPVTNWCYGGLTYQVEHHLFPALAHNRLGAAQRSVTVVCRERDIPYHETSVVRAYTEILVALGVAAAPLRTEYYRRIRSWVQVARSVR